MREAGHHKMTRTERRSWETRREVGQYSRRLKVAQTRVVAAEEAEGSCSGHISVAQPAGSATTRYARVESRWQPRPVALSHAPLSRADRKPGGRALAGAPPGPRLCAPPIVAGLRALSWQPRPASGSRGSVLECGLRASEPRSTCGLGPAVPALGVTSVLLPGVPSQEGSGAGDRRKPSRPF